MGSVWIRLVAEERRYGGIGHATFSNECQLCGACCGSSSHRTRALSPYPSLALSHRLTIIQALVGNEGVDGSFGDKHSHAWQS